MILITGGTGVIGTRLVDEWLKEGHRIRVLALPSDRTPLERDARVDVRYGDISNKENIKGICKGVSTVYHLAAVILSLDEGVFERVNVNGTRNIVEEAKDAGVEHFVYISSASVVYPKKAAYNLSKWKAEEIVRASGLNYTVIRPTLVYSDTGGEEFNNYLDYLKKFPIVPFIGKGEAKKRPVHVDDIAEGLLAVYGNKNAYGKIYNFSGSEVISILDFTRLCLKLMGMSNKPIIRLPAWLCYFIAFFMKISMKHPPLRPQMIAGIIQDADLDPSEAQKDLGFKARPVSEVLPKNFKRGYD